MAMRLATSVLPVMSIHIFREEKKIKMGKKNKPV